MRKQIHSYIIGNWKRLVLEVDEDNSNEKDFADDCERAAASKPVSIQEFFTNLARLQRNKQERIIEDVKPKRQIK